ncbi:unnamed protein product, partial [Leptidea sinapis]
MDPNIYALVLDTLNRATSQNTDVLKPAEKKLEEWEIEPGFYSVLLNVMSNHSVDVNVRWLAVMCFKNGVDRYWRRNAPHAISDDEKIKLRQGLLTSSVLSEPVTQIATQEAVLISKIARFDCPNNWPNLVPDLLGALKASQPLVQHRSLLIFHHVVKELASKRLFGDRRTFQGLTETVYGFILGLWHENTELFIRHIQEGAATELITEHLEKALLCLRILRKLTVFGFKKANLSQDAVAFLNVVFDRAKMSLECIALGVLSNHPFAYVPLIRPSLEFALYYCFMEQGMSLTYERFTIQCLNIIKGILHCREFKVPNLPQSEIKEPMCHMCRHLVTHYFLLSSDDLAMWDAEPESFATDKAGETWKYSLRTCTKAVFKELLQERSALLRPELVRLLASLQETPVLPEDLPAILKKDAIYNAVDFDEWFTNVLSRELKIRDNNYRIIRRRVCLLIDQWCDVRAAKTLFPAMYEALLEPLSRPDEDAAVKLAAAEALRSTIDAYNFDVEQFAPYAHHALVALYDLLVESEECDTKMHVLHVISYVMAQCGNLVGRTGGGTSALFAYLPQLWQHAASHHMLRAAALAAVADPQLLELAQNLYPILEQSTEHLRIVMYIMQAYALLCPEEFFSSQGGKCMVLLDSMLSDMRTEGIITVLKMAEVSLLDSDDLPMVFSVQLCLLSRVILLSSDLFYKAIEDAAKNLREYDSDPVQVLNKLLHVWTEKMNIVTQVLETLKNQVGLETYEQLIQSVDKETLKQIKEYIPL